MMYVRFLLLLWNVEDFFTNAPISSFTALPDVVASTWLGIKGSFILFAETGLHSCESADGGLTWKTVIGPKCLIVREIDPVFRNVVTHQRPLIPATFHEVIINQRDQCEMKKWVNSIRKSTHPYIKRTFKALTTSLYAFQANEEKIQSAKIVLN
jgi:hypothetical protein